MPRNFYRRVEVMYPVEAPELKSRILHQIVPTILRDNVKARVLLPDGSYTRIPLADGQPLHRSQEELMLLHSVAQAEPVASANGQPQELPKAAVRS
jgi:polyphosphate kinase